MLPSAPVRRALAAPRSGWLAALPARDVGLALVALGGGRQAKGAEIDRGVGFEFPRRPGERVEAGEAWCVIHARSEADADGAAERLNARATWSEEAVELAAVVTRAIP